MSKNMIQIIEESLNGRYTIIFIPYFSTGSKIYSYIIFKQKYFWNLFPLSNFQKPALRKTV